MDRILADAAGSVRSVAALAVFDERGRPVARAGLPPDSIPEALAPAFSPGTELDAQFAGAEVTPGGYPRVAYTTPLVLEGERVGYLWAVLNGARILDLTTDSTGLGRTGEVMVVTADPGGTLRTLHPVRHPPEALEGAGPGGEVSLTGRDDPALKALAGEEGVFKEGLVDYRGEPVWAATRFNGDTGWGLVVKFDAAEKKSAIFAFRERMFAVALSLGGIGMLVAVFLGLRFAAPIHSLSEVARHIREGDLDARAAVKREDEIGFLALTFNEMADELEVRLTEAHEFQKFFEVSLKLLCIAGVDGYFKRTNPAFEKSLGWTSEQLLSRPFFDLVHPDDLQATKDEIESLSRGIPTISFVNRFRCADGSWKWLRWTSYPEPETGLLYASAREVEGPQEA